eukprot:COSAG02_NODE_483_length_21396_cov_20.544801_9_plen_150_part_00
MLVWALGSNLPDDDLNFYGPRNQTEFPGNSRLIDPQVICPNAAIHNLEPCPSNRDWMEQVLADSRVRNLTLPAGIGKTFSRVWTTVEAQRNAAGGVPLNPGQWADWFAELRQQPGARAIDVQPLRPRHCTSVERCIGTNALGDCVCYDD